MPGLSNIYPSHHAGALINFAPAGAATASGTHQPEHALPLNNSSEFFEFDYVSRDGSFEAEQRILETTHAHELLWNGDMEIAGGSLPALIEQLTTHDAKPDKDFVFAFMLTFRLFTSPATFAQSLVRRFESVGEDNLWSKPVQTRVLKVVKDWLEIYWQAHTDEEALPIIYRFAAGILGAAFPAAGKRILDSIERVFDYGQNSVVLRLRPMTGRSHAGWAVDTATTAQAPTPSISKSQLNALRNNRDGHSNCSILDFDPLEVARQITLMESRLFRTIQPHELLASAWMKKRGPNSSNVNTMSRLSTDLANLVADTILGIQDYKKRALMIEQWVKVAMRCAELKNYDGVLAIICALTSSAVERLKETWGVVSEKNKGRLGELKKTIDLSNNYAVLRKSFENEVPPAIPFLGMYLTDLTFIDAGNSETRQLPGREGRSTGVTIINFDKHARTARVVREIQRFQAPYDLAAVPEMQAWLDTEIDRVHFADQTPVDLHRRSTALEPRTTLGAAARLRR
ncbi:hypothetical protein B0A49_03848 [Cryomyces minteri]|uniref:Ras-GEF domain-containing protein n=1 Tax=Cryomyces minteri TaxID=331657 RepID=A0A4U0XPD6_9PEZI|nr:hypothetical protein B0A49_03848 [Cryomyces minteri]